MKNPYILPERIIATYNFSVFFIINDGLEKLAIYKRSWYNIKAVLLHTARLMYQGSWAHIRVFLIQTRFAGGK